jgi:hypothetical protein
LVSFGLISSYDVLLQLPFFWNKTTSGLVSSLRLVLSLSWLKTRDSAGWAQEWQHHDELLSLHPKVRAVSSRNTCFRGAVQTQSRRYMMIYVYFFL